MTDWEVAEQLPAAEKLETFARLITLEVIGVVSERVGAVAYFEIVTDALVVELPAESAITAVSVWLPSASPVTLIVEVNALAEQDPPV